MAWPLGQPHAPKLVTLPAIELPPHDDAQERRELTGYLAEQRILINDRVKVECTPYDLTKGLITYRFNRP